MRDSSTKTEKLLEFFYSLITEERKNKVEEVLADRTRYLTVVLENIYQPHNASAAIRTCDCFGIQDLHVIENSYEFYVSKKVVQGSSKWVDLYQYNEKPDNTREALNALKKKGYRIVATSPKQDATSLMDLDLNKGKIALVFGTEQNGISERVEELADEFITIPMYGFTESFNISVSVALCLQQLKESLIKSDIDWRLSSSEKNELKLDWARRTLRNPEILEREFLLNLK